MVANPTSPTLATPSRVNRMLEDLTSLRNTLGTPSHACLTCGFNLLLSHSVIDPTSVPWTPDCTGLAMIYNQTPGAAALFVAHLCTTLFLCRKLSPRATARATSLPLLAQSNSCVPACSSRQRALRRSPP